MIPTDDWTTMRHVVDTMSAGAIVGALLGFLPAAAAFGAIVWYAIQIYESRTFQHWINNRRMIWRARRLASLRAQEKLIIAKIEAVTLIKTAERVARATVADAISEAAREAAHVETTIQSEQDVKSNPPQ